MEMRNVPSFSPPCVHEDRTNGLLRFTTKITTPKLSLAYVNHSYLSAVVFFYYIHIYVDLVLHLYYILVSHRGYWAACA